MEREEFERQLKHLPWAGMVSVVLFFLHHNLRKYEEDPSKPLSHAFAYVSVGYVVFLLAHLFTVAKYPRFRLFATISWLCALAGLYIIISAIYFQDSTVIYGFAESIPS